jgi:hypothetical protein
LSVDREACGKTVDELGYGDGWLTLFCAAFNAERFHRYKS